MNKQSERAPCTVSLTRLTEYRGPLVATLSYSPNSGSQISARRHPILTHVLLFLSSPSPSHAKPMGRDSVVAIANRYGLEFRGSNPCGSEIFCKHRDCPWGLPSVQYSEYRVSFPEVKRLGHGVDHPLPPSVEFKERVELYHYSPSGLSWPVVG